MIIIIIIIIIIIDYYYGSDDKSTGHFVIIAKQIHQRNYQDSLISFLMEMETATSGFLSRASLGVNLTSETVMASSVNETNISQNLSNLNSSEEADASLSGINAFDYFKFSCTTLGFIGNLLTLITLSKNGKRFSRLILILFQHQSFCDCLVCAMASAVILQPHLWLSGNKIFDYFVCHCWHSQVSVILFYLFNPW